MEIEATRIGAAGTPGRNRAGRQPPGKAPGSAGRPGEHAQVLTSRALICASFLPRARRGRRRERHTRLSVLLSPADLSRCRPSSTPRLLNVRTRERVAGADPGQGLAGKHPAGKHGTGEPSQCRRRRQRAPPYRPRSSLPARTPTRNRRPPRRRGPATIPLRGAQHPVPVTAAASTQAAPGRQCRHPAPASTAIPFSSRNRPGPAKPRPSPAVIIPGRRRQNRRTPVDNYTTSMPANAAKARQTERLIERLDVVQEPRKKGPADEIAAAAWAGAIVASMRGAVVRRATLPRAS